ncbi:MAG: hypothetical protein Ta2F_02490 [Termitinemataceae bacterium]|nr:MAG: hypothetical protein Ta2F_02490 [Termitinemataceae bacterium]
MLFSACRSGSNSEEIIEVIDNPNEPPAVPTVMITVSGDYTGTTLTVNYLEKPAQASTNTKSISGTITDGTVQLASYPPRGALIVSITAGSKTSYVGRLVGSSAIQLKFNLDTSGNLGLRPADDGKIPIGTYAEFQLISGALDGNYIQEADIDFMGDSGISGVPDWIPIGTDTAPFTGTYDGDGKKIARLYINKPSDNNVGLFSYAAGAATFTGVHIASGSVTGVDYVGGLLARSASDSTGSINNCSNGADINGRQGLGGIIGFAASANFNISACYNTGSVKGNGGTSDSAGIGGVVGYFYADITACYNLGEVQNTASQAPTGGVAGYLYLANMTGCYNAGAVVGSSTTGGLVGRILAISGTYRQYITACYNLANVQGGTYTGGLIGVCGTYTNDGLYTITASYNTGSVTGGTYHHGIVGKYGYIVYAMDDDAKTHLAVSASYWKGDESTDIGWTGSEDNVGKFTTDYFTPSTGDSAEWGTGDGSGSGKYWKVGTTGGTMLPKLWYEK